MPELRKDPVTGRWVIISETRGKRPTNFPYQPARRTNGGFCPFCTGNESTTPPEVLAYRSNGGPPNSPGWTLRVVPNKFPALRIEGELNKAGDGIFDRMNGIGAHEVVIETPDHHETLSTMPLARLEGLLWAYRERILDLKRDTRFSYVLVFKNEGEPAGATLEHSHSQIIALPIVPIQVREEMAGAQRHYDYKERCIYCDIVRQELNTATRIIVETRAHVALCPYAPRFPFEVWILPKRHMAAYTGGDPELYGDLAQILSQVLRRLDRALNVPPYNYILHTAPFRHEDSEFYHWHMELMPKLTRVAGFEWGSGFYINPTPPEEAARALREVQL